MLFRRKIKPARFKHFPAGCETSWPKNLAGFSTLNLKRGLKPITQIKHQSIVKIGAHGNGGAIVEVVVKVDAKVYVIDDFPVDPCFPVVSVPSCLGEADEEGLVGGKIDFGFVELEECEVQNDGNFIKIGGP
jgi:hypothetical protein